MMIVDWDHMHDDITYYLPHLLMVSLNHHTIESVLILITCSAISGNCIHIIVGAATIIYRNR